MAGHAGMKSALILVTVLAIAMLAACGKKGNPSPPGPPDQITYPRSYPTH
jgi:hypothetical protein